MSGHPVAAHAAPARPLDGRHLRMYRGGFLIFLISEAFVFVTLIALRFLVAGTGRPATLEGAPAAVATILFLVSAALPLRAVEAIARDDERGMARWLAVSIGVGLVAGAVVTRDLLTSSVDPASLFGAVYAASGWIHLGHVAGGLLFLAAVLSAGRAHRFSAGDHWVAEAAARFWLFVVGAWLALYVTFFWV